MKIRDLCDKVYGLPSHINVILADETHPYMGLYEEAPADIKDLKFKSAYIRLKP